MVRFGFWCFVDCVGVAGVWWVTLGTVFWWLLCAGVAVVVMVFSSGFGCFSCGGSVCGFAACGVGVVDVCLWLLWVAVGFMWFPA